MTCSACGAAFSALNPHLETQLTLNSLRNLAERRRPENALKSASPMPVVATPFSCKSLRIAANSHGTKKWPRIADLAPARIPTSSAHPPLLTSSQLFHALSTQNTWNFYGTQGTHQFVAFTSTSPSANCGMRPSFTSSKHDSASRSPAGFPCIYFDVVHGVLRTGHLICTGIATLLHQFLSDS